MKQTFYDSENLRKARALHDEALRLHLAPPPIVTWGAKIYEPSGEQVEEILAKSNSYTRNALNAIACQGTWIARYQTPYSGLISGGFEDGKLGSKDVGGTTYANCSHFYQYPVNTGTGVSDTDFSFLAGYSDSAESIDSYILGSEFGTGTSVNQLTKGASARSSTWDSANRKFVTTYSRQFTNGYGSSQIIKEIGLKINGSFAESGGNILYLVLRDVLASPITLISGQTVILYYQLEATVA